MHVKQQEVATFVVGERRCCFFGVFLGIAVTRLDLMFAGRKPSRGCLFRPVTERKSNKVTPKGRSKLLRTTCNPTGGLGQSGTYKVLNT